MQARHRSEECLCHVAQGLDLWEVDFCPNHLPEQAHVGLCELKQIETVIMDDLRRRLVFDGEHICEECFENERAVVDDAMLDEVLLAAVPVPLLKGFRIEQLVLSPVFREAFRSQVLSAGNVMASLEIHVGLIQTVFYRDFQFKASEA
jgi:hypothetical protein